MAHNHGHMQGIFTKESDSDSPRNVPRNEDESMHQNLIHDLLQKSKSTVNGRRSKKFYENSNHHFYETDLLKSSHMFEKQLKLEEPNT